MCYKITFTVVVEKAWVRNVMPPSTKQEPVTSSRLDNIDLHEEAKKKVRVRVRVRVRAI